MTKKPKLSASHIKAIGEMVVATTRIESVILDLIGIFMGSQSVLHTVAGFSHQQLSSNIDTLSALASIGYEKKDIQNDTFTALLNQVRHVADFRNTVVHAHWTIDEDGKALAVRYHARGYFSRMRKPISAEEIRKRVAEAAEIEKELRVIRGSLLSPVTTPAPRPHQTT